MTFLTDYPDFGGIESLAPPPGIEGLTSLKATWKAALPGAGRAIGNYNVYVADSPSSFDFSAPTAQTLLTSYTLSGLPSGEDYYVTVRTMDDQGLEEENTVWFQARTSIAQPIEFGGLQTAVLGSGVNAFNTVILSWTPATGTFDKYRIYRSLTPDGFDYASPLKEVDSSENGVTLNSLDGISGNQSYYFVVRAENSSSGDTDGNEKSKLVTTSPQPPEFLGVATVEVAPGAAGLDSVDIAFNPAVGVYNKYRVFVRFPDRSDGTEVFDFSLTGDSKDFANYFGQLGGVETTKRLSGLPQDELVCVAVRAVWHDGTNFLADNQSPISERCATPTLTAPSFGGVVTATKASTSPEDQSQIAVGWTAATGVYDKYVIYAGLTAAKARALASDPLELCDTGLSTCRFEASDDAVDFTVTGLPPGQESHFVVRAVYSISGVSDGNLVTASATTASMDAQLVWLTQPKGVVPGQGTLIKVGLRDGDGNPITNVSIPVTIILANGSGVLEGATANTFNSVATFNSFKFIDDDPDIPQKYQLIATAPNISSSGLSNVTQNAQGACFDEFNFYETRDGGCYDPSSGLVFSDDAPESLNWHEAIKGCFSGTECDIYVGDPQGTTDNSPETGYCQDLVESGYDDWRMPTKIEISSMIIPPNAPHYVSGPNYFFNLYILGSGTYVIVSDTANSTNGYSTFHVNSAGYGFATPYKSSPMRVVCVRNP